MVFFLCSFFAAQGAAAVESAGHMKPYKVCAAVHFLSIQFKFFILEILSKCLTSMTAAEQQYTVFYFLVLQAIKSIKLKGQCSKLFVL